MNDLYDVDILEWCERQVGLLRRVAAGEPINEPIDWPNVIEELEAVGRTELRACESLLRQALIHLLKLQAWPASQAATHWRAGIPGFLFEARAAFSPSVRQRINLAALYRIAVQQVRLAADKSGLPNKLAELCPWTLDELLSGDDASLLGSLTDATRGGVDPLG